MTELPSPAALVRALDARAKKSFGQHFLTDAGILDRIVRLAKVGEGTPVLEIGPGPGGLTVRLLAAGAEVVAIDADADMVAHLADALPHERLDVRRGDATSGALYEVLGAPPRTVVSNLPYNAAAAILVGLIDAPSPPQRMVLMFQLEVARRVVCAGNERAFGALGFVSNLYYRTRLSFTLPPGAFRPPPKVDSGVVLLERHPTPLCDDDTAQLARRLARQAFAQRRKMLRKSLSGTHDDMPGVFAAAEIAPTARPEALDVAAFVRLARALAERS